MFKKLFLFSVAVFYSFNAFANSKQDIFNNIQQKTNNKYENMETMFKVRYGCLNANELVKNNTDTTLKNAINEGSLEFNHCYVIQNIPKDKIKYANETKTTTLKLGSHNVYFSNVKLESSEISYAVVRFKDSKSQNGYLSYKVQYLVDTELDYIK